MQAIYQARRWNPEDYHHTLLQTDFDDEASARLAIEAAGAGELVKFNRQANMPHCLPAFVDRSVWMETYSNGSWRRHNIHG